MSVTKESEDRLIKNTLSYNKELKNTACALKVQRQAGGSNVLVS
jgi:hypothetical protein